MSQCLRSRAIACLALVLVATAAPALSDVYSVDFEGGRSDRIETARMEGFTYFRLVDIARAFGASRHWNPRTSKMSLAVGIHRLSMSSDSPFIALDDEVMNVGAPVRMREGEYWIPRRLLTVGLGLAVNSDIAVDSVNSTIFVSKLGAEVMSLDVEEHPGVTAAILWMNDRAEFAASSRDRGRVDLFLPGASLADSMMVVAGLGLVTEVSAERTEAGVNVVVRVAPSATSYDAQMHTDPPRLEVTVTAERQESMPSPMLKGTKNLLGAGTSALDIPDDGVTTIMLDPGHGGADLGYARRSGMPEKDVALQLAEEAARYLRNEGYYVFMTRTSDSYVPNKRRAEIANLAAADIFVSIHCGSWHSGGARGFRVSYYSPTRDYIVDKNRAGGKGLRRGNHGARRGGIGDLMWGEIQESMTSQSRALAKAVGNNMAATLPNYDRGVGGADLAVLAGCAMPAILVEAAFITNASDAALLADAGFRENVGRAIARGVADYRRSAGGRNR